MPSTISVKVDFGAITYLAGTSSYRHNKIVLTNIAVGQHNLKPTPFRTSVYQLAPPLDRPETLPVRPLIVDQRPLMPLIHGVLTSYTIAYCSFNLLRMWKYFPSSIIPPECPCLFILEYHRVCECLYACVCVCGCSCALYCSIDIDEHRCHHMHKRTIAECILLPSCCKSCWQC